VYAPNGKELAFVMDDLLYVMPVDTHGLPNGAAFALNDETTDAPTWSGDSSSILYLHNGELHLISRATRAITSIAAPLTYTVSKPDQKLLIHAGRFWSGQGPDEQKDVDILISRNRIERIAPHASVHPEGVRVVDASALTAIPGALGESRSSQFAQLHLLRRPDGASLACLRHYGTAGYGGQRVSSSGGARILRFRRGSRTKALRDGRGDRRRAHLLFDDDSDDE
jgi:hypothetical protein